MMFIEPYVHLVGLSVVISLFGLNILHGYFKKK